MLNKFQFIVLFVLLTCCLQAQYKISGKVVDSENGQTLSGANIVLEKSFLSTVSGTDGSFVIKNLHAGHYRLKISYVGYNSYQQKLLLHSNVELKIKLTPTAFMSDEVIISATRVSNNSPSTHVDIGAKVLNKRNMGQDLPYLLKMTPSIVVSSDAGAGTGYTSMRIRGSDLTHINVTLNGVPVNDAESQDVYFVDLPDLSSSVDNIQIQRGVGTSTNGAAAFGASINIKTDKFNPKAYTILNSATGSFNTLKNTLNFGTGLLNKHWIVNGRLSQIHSDGYIERASSDLRSAYLSAAYYGNKDLFKAIVLLGHEKTYQAWYGVPKDSLATHRTFNPAGAMYDASGNFLGYYKNQTDNYTQNYYQLHYARQLTDRFRLTSAAFLTRGYGYYESYKNQQKFSKYGLSDTIIGGDTINSTNLIRRKWLNNYFYGFNFSTNYSNSRLKLIAGGSWNRYDGDHYGKIIWSQIARLNSINRNWYFNTGLKTEFNVFTKIAYQPDDKFNVMLDLQYRKINYNITGTHDDLRNLTQEHKFSFFNPKAGIYYNLNQYNKTWFSIAVSNREPNRTVYRDADPNQKVKSEQLLDYELGYRFTAQIFSVEVDAFFMDYKNQLVLTGKINNVGTAIMTNVPKSYRVGVEISATWQMLKQLRWQANASFSKNKIKNFTAYVDNWNYWDNPGNQPYQYVKNLGTTDISFSPDLIAGSNLTWNSMKNLELSWSSKYVSRQYIDNTSSLERSLRPYWVNDLRVEYTFHPKFVEQIGLSFILNHFLNEQYESNAWVYRYVYNNKEQEMNGYFPQAGIHFMVGMRIKL